MADCVICHNSETSRFWSGQGGTNLVCSFTCASVKEGGIHLGLGLILGFFGIYLVVDNPDIGNWIIFFLFLFLISAFFVYSYFQGKSVKDEKFREKKMRMEAENRIHLPNSSKQVYVEALDKDYHPCCYQSARLGDQYCACGRAVDKELITHFEQ